MKTLADLKRELVVGSSLTLIDAPTMPEHKYLNIKRYVVKKQGNGVYLNQDKEATRGSFLEFTNAKLTEYDGKNIKVYDIGKRNLTEHEQQVFDNKPSNRAENQKQIEVDILTDGSTVFWKDRAYLKEHNMPYLMSTSGGTKHLNYNDMTISDMQVRGKLALHYVVESEGK